MNSIIKDIYKLSFAVVRLFRPKLFIYLIISRNKIEMENLSNGKTLSKTSKEDFSSDRLLIADSRIAENLGREMLKNICNDDLKSRTISIILHPLEKGFEKIYPVEKMIYRDFIHCIGGQEVFFEDSIAKLDKRTLEERIRTMPNHKK